MKRAALAVMLLFVLSFPEVETAALVCSLRMSGPEGDQ
jgi:hypothetical protein